MAISYRDENERLVAEQAIAVYRATVEAMETAEHGKGLATMEAAVMEHGQAHLAELLKRAISAHGEAQKGGPALGSVPAVRTRRSRTTSRRRSSRRQGK
jgi:hypothetical protein